MMNFGLKSMFLGLHSTDCKETRVNYRGSSHIEHNKNKKIVMNTYAIKKLLELTEDMEMVARDKKNM